VAAVAVASTALYTDHYELTMLDAALRAGTADRRVVFEVFTRELPVGRRYGVFGGLGRLLDAVAEFQFGPTEIDWLSARGFLSGATLDWLRSYRFGGTVYAYAEGEIYTGGSPVLTVEGSFAECVLLETLVLSILNYDSSVAAAASLIAVAAGDRPVIEMGSRRIDPGAATAAARAAYLGGLASTSNLEAGRAYGVPTAGTVAHAFVLLFSDELAAFSAQVEAFGSDTTLLVDTFDTGAGIRDAVAAAGLALGAARIDSGDLAGEARRARALLDSLGAVDTKIILTGDLDDRIIASLADTPADGYGAGTSVVTGLGHPTAGFIYKLVAVEGRPVAKTSPGKGTLGGRKWAWRSGAADVVALSPTMAPAGGRPLQSTVILDGARQPGPSLQESREWHHQVVGQLDPSAEMRLVRMV
jgi:nicotinate phosphoribosyltransferase